MVVSAGAKTWRKKGSKSVVGNSAFRQTLIDGMHFVQISDFHVFTLFGGQHESRVYFSVRYHCLYHVPMFFAKIKVGIVRLLLKIDVSGEAR